MTKLNCAIQFYTNGLATETKYTTIIGSNVNPITGIQSTTYGNQTGIWTYFLYNYYNVGYDYERISFSPNSVTGDVTSFMYILGQGGTYGLNGLNYPSSGPVSNYGGGGGGGGGGQAYTNQLSFLVHPIFVTLYACGSTSNSEYMYSLYTDVDGDDEWYYKNKIKVANGTNGGNGGNATSSKGGNGGSGGNGLSDGVGGTDTGYGGGAGGNGGAGGMGGGGTSNGSNGSAGDGKAADGSGNTQDGTNGQSGSNYYGSAGSTTIYFADGTRTYNDGTKPTLGAGGTGGSVNNSITATAGNSSQFMFYYFHPC